MLPDVSAASRREPESHTAVPAAAGNPAASTRVGTFVMSPGEGLSHNYVDLNYLPANPLAFFINLAAGFNASARRITLQLPDIRPAECDRSADRGGKERQVRVLHLVSGLVSISKCAPLSREAHVCQVPRLRLYCPKLTVLASEDPVAPSSSPL